MRHDLSLSLAQAARLNGIKPETVKRYFPSDLRKSKGRFRVTKSDRHSATLYLPDAEGNVVPRDTRSFKERKDASRFLRDLNRYQRGRANELSDWKGRTIGGADLLTDPRTIREVEPALSDFSLYRTFSGGRA